MPCVVVHAMTSHTHHAAYTSRQACCPHGSMACHNLIICLPFVPAEGHLPKLAASHSNGSNIKITNQKVLERIPIAMQDENRADCNENF